MKRSAFDAIVGIIVILSGLFLSFECLGVERTLTLLLIWAAGAAVIRLWNGGSAFGKIVAAVLVPAVLLHVLLPKDLRLAVSMLPSEEEIAIEAEHEGQARNADAKPII